MTRLRVYRDQHPEQPCLDSTAAADIAAALAPHGVRFERWVLNADSAESSNELSAYAEPIARVQREHGYATVDVVSMRPDHPERAAIRQRFLAEHSHDEDEVRLFTEGSGLFCLHIGAEVFALVCEQGDLLSVPAGVTHWFDMGASPRFTALRFFENPAGWVPRFTGCDIASRFPSFDDLTANARSTLVLVDIEGTLSPISFVREVLFPYARERLPAFLQKSRQEPRVVAALHAIHALTGVDIEDERGLLAQLAAWQSADAKVTPLKQLQGLVWEEGYRRGELRAPLYPDARIRLSSWHRAGVPLVVYSSGSEHAQRLFFQYSSAGDIRSWFAGYHDTTTGRKHDERSYRAIARRFGKAPATFLFISDCLRELDAAQAAGMRTCWITRDEAKAPPPARALQSSPRHPLPHGHPAVTQLLDVAL